LEEADVQEVLYLLAAELAEENIEQLTVLSALQGESYIVDRL
jgi:hypothetical protein